MIRKSTPLTRKRLARILNKLRPLGAVLALLGALPGFAAAQNPALPSKIAYDVYVFDQKAGRNEISVKKEGNRLVFESTSKLTSGEYSHDLVCRTEVSLPDMQPTLFQYKGTRVGMAIEGTVRIEGDSLVGTISEGNNDFPSGMDAPDNPLFFENYVPEHQLVIYQRTAMSDNPIFRFNVIFPSSFATITAVAGLESEVELGTMTKPAICRKYQVLFNNSSPFFGYVDIDRGIPVYMDFPSANTEFFLAGAFGDSPPTKYRNPEKSDF